MLLASIICCHLLRYSVEIVFYNYTILTRINYACDICPGRQLTQVCACVCASVRVCGAFGVARWVVRSDPEALFAMAEEKCEDMAGPMW